MTTPTPDTQQPPPPRPTSFAPRELNFTPRKPVSWLGPVLLAATGARVALATQFGAYLDKRELQVAFPQQVYDFSDREELWLDFAADLGDGFDATYAVAYLLAQPKLDIAGVPLPRGELLVLGGDQVYPTPSGQQYEDRFEGPYRAALPVAPNASQPPIMFALPGNHDWYDGLTAFLRLFARRGGNQIGGWRTCQTRSYFALKLPHRWWLFAIDAQRDAYLDDPQLEYFREAAKGLRAGDKVILCTPQPSWVEASEQPAAYDTVDYFVRTVIAPTGADVALMLTGDLHHYSRYVQQGGERHLITFGGGGAYLYGTHELPTRISVPPKKSIARKASPSRLYQLARTYPSRARSRALCTKVFARLPLRNPGFVALVGSLHVLLLLALDNSARRIITMPIFLTVAVTLGLTLFFSVGLTGGRRGLRHYLLGLGHGAAHVGLAIGGLQLWRLLPFDMLPWPLPVLIAAAAYGPVAGVVASQLVAAYLVVAAPFGVNLNELFASMGIEGYKGFLRLHIAPDKTMTIYAIGIDRIPKRWRTNPQASPTAPWFEPAKPLAPRLVDDPVVLGQSREYRSV